MGKINLEAQQLGRKDCKKADGDLEGYNNPYKEGTEEFISYRRGWNMYFDKAWKKQINQSFESNEI